MGTMLQGYDLSLADFDGHEGCNEVLSRTRPDVVRAIHDAYFEAGVDAVETNTFGANLAALGEYGIVDQIFDLSATAARIARDSADAYATPDRPRFVLGSVGPGTKLPTLGHIGYAALRDAYQVQVEGMLSGGHEIKSPTARRSCLSILSPSTFDSVSDRPIRVPTCISNSSCRAFWATRIRSRRS